MIQTNDPVVTVVGTGAGNNLMGAWLEVIPVVLATSVWCVMFVSRVLPVGPFGAINLELGIGDPGLERRVWKSMCLILGGGNNLEYDDSFFSVYCPFNFQKDVRISVRTARLSSTGQTMAVQLQLYS